MALKVTGIVVLDNIVSLTVLVSNHVSIFVVFLTYLLDAVQTGLATYLAWFVFIINVSLLCDELDLILKGYLCPQLGKSDDR